LSAVEIRPREEIRTNHFKTVPARFVAAEHHSRRLNRRNLAFVNLENGWIGLWIVFGHANVVAIAAVAAVVLGVRLFVVFL